MLPLFCTAILGRFMGDVMLTADEIRGLTANLLVSPNPPTAPTQFTTWLKGHLANIGRTYVSELVKRS
jgi:hypothetical protein